MNENLFSILDLFKQFTKAQIINVHNNPISCNWIIHLWINWFENQLSRRHLFTKFHNLRNNSKIEGKIQVQFVDDEREEKKNQKKTMKIAQNSFAIPIISLVLFQSMSTPTLFLVSFLFILIFSFNFKVLFGHFRTVDLPCWLLDCYRLLIARRQKQLILYSFRRFRLSFVIFDSATIPLTHTDA